MPIASELQRSSSFQLVVCPVCSMSDCSHVKTLTKRSTSIAGGVSASKAAQVDADDSADTVTEAGDDCLSSSSSSHVRKRGRRSIRRALTPRHHQDDWVDISSRRLSTKTVGALYPGSRFEGTQECGSTQYEVVVDIKHINLEESTLSGYLTIKGLTSEFLELTTFFEAEIVGPRYMFLTRKWQAYQKIDLEHWKRFPSFEPYINVFHRDDFKYDPTNQDCIYMRWKEHFMVPDHRVRSIDGASFEGFYYICYRRSTNSILGYYYYYYHSDWYQELKLRHVGQRSFGHFEFR